MENQTSGLDTAIKVFMVLSCIGMGFALIPLCWTIPMTTSVFRKINEGEEIGVGLKVCVLLFMGLLPGILLLCRKENSAQ